jgi:hypothetical protein
MVAASLRRGSAAMRLPMFTSASTSRLPVASVARPLRRYLATEAGPHVEESGPQVKAAGTTVPLAKMYTVEELHEESAEALLREGGTRKEASMRHFTVNFG